MMQWSCRHAPTGQEELFTRPPAERYWRTVPTWRNWQTRQTQNLVLVRVCGSTPPSHHIIQRLALNCLTCCYT